MTDLTLRSKNIDFNDFKSGVLSETIEEYLINFEYTRDDKGELSNTKDISHVK